MSTGDVRRPPVTKLSTKAAASDGPEPEVLDSSPKGGVLPAKKTSSATKTTPAKKAAGAKTAPTKTAPTKKAAGARGPVKAGGGKGRKPPAPVRVSQGRNWGPIAMFGSSGLVAVLIVGFGAFQVFRHDHKPSWTDQASKIAGIHNYKVSNPEWFVSDPQVGNHKAGPLTYPLSPPVGGVHNPTWQNCMGDVYPAEIPKEQAVHSLEHGAVWITYKPDLPKDQVDALAAKVRDKSFMLMSPYPGLDSPISLQAWGYQLKLDNAGDKRIDQFINALRQNATQEPQAGCSGGITDTGTVPLDLPSTGN